MNTGIKVTYIIHYQNKSLNIQFAGKYKIVPTSDISFSNFQETKNLKFFFLSIYVNMQTKSWKNLKFVLSFIILDTDSLEIRKKKKKKLIHKSL